ncbi:VirB8 family type IV secretion system protein [Francisella philomiragia]|uniref:type IV secretion system protein n=1 Tax=Francisella philomiragia TaxID=28110 RepID=UPI001902D413|nr:type IV secretion system protein [Francisella philomiragia]MBK2270170.1 type IV secretion system protein [Francisella philomiragia]MBK2275834.1 type IV secretion system protein [Francisella philomiragia]MBK2305047.1 type IV secretion system protein [Francisella philomiragia]
MSEIQDNKDKYLKDKNRSNITNDLGDVEVKEGSNSKPKDSVKSKLSLKELIINWFNPPKNEYDEKIEEAHLKIINLINDDPKNPYIGVNAALSSLAYEYTKISQKDKKISRVFMTLTAIFFCSTMYLATTVKTKPFIVGMNQNGQVFDLNSSIKNIKNSDLQNRLALFYANKFIKDVISVSPDGDVNNQNQEAAYATVRGAASNALREYYRQNDPRKIAEKYTVSYDMNYILPLSQNTIKVDWTQTTRNSKTNAVVSSQKYVAEITYKWDKRSGNELIQTLNPLGFYVDSVTIERDNT